MLTKKDKTVLRYLVKEHIAGIKKNKPILKDETIKGFVAEVRYDKYLKELAKKLK